jgi:hypothetical protein
VLSLVCASAVEHRFSLDNVCDLLLTRCDSYSKLFLLL